MIWRNGGSLRHLEVHVRPDFRRTVVFGLAAFVALVAGHQVGGVHASSLRMRLIAYGCAVLAGLGGFVASRTAAREVQRIAVARAGDVAGTPLRMLVLLAGYLTTVTSVCDLVGVQLQQLAVGGAITGIVIGLAAQPVLGNLFAGLVLVFARPYVPGQRVRVMSGALNGPHVGVIVSAGLLYTVLNTDAGPLNIPNSSLLASAVGPAELDPEPSLDCSPDLSTQDDNAAANTATVVAAAESYENSARKHSGSSMYS